MSTQKYKILDIFVISLINIALKRILTSFWILGLLIAMPLAIYFTPFFEKYKIVLLKTEILPSDARRTYYRDLDHDGTMETIRSFEAQKMLAFQIFTEKGKIFDQYNFSHTYLGILNQLYFGDIDDNNIDEVYGFSMGGDSLFLNWYTLDSHFKGYTQSFFISRIGLYIQKEFNFSIGDFSMVDFENDGGKKIVFSCNAGFSVTPRKIYIFKPQSGELKQSDDDGIPAFNLIFDDLDGDQIKEIITSSAASGHLKGKDSVDYYPWLRVFNSDLKYFFPKVRFEKGMVNKLYVFPSDQDQKSLKVFHVFPGANDGYPVKIYRFNAKGIKTDSLRMPVSMDKIPNTCILQESPSQFILNSGKNFIRLSDELKILKAKETKVFYPEIRKVNWTASEKGELLAMDAELKTMVVFSEDLRKLVKLELPETIRYWPEITLLKNGQFMLASGNREYYYQFAKNNLFWLEYPFYLIIYLLSAGFIFLIQKITERQLKERYELKNQVRELQMKAFNNQMDPHFMFNLFTVMAGLMKKGEQEEAFQAFLKFTKLIRSNLENGDQITRTLGEELQVVTDFLNLSKLRFKEKLNFRMHIDPEVDQQIPVPKMCLQIHLENGLKHGLAPKKGEGNLLVVVQQNDGFLQLTIQDDGIGRAKAAKSEVYSTKKGLKMLQSVYDLLNESNHLKISQRITDLLDETGEASGTRVDIVIPVNLKAL
jgi:sensor histidine kinase YesM